MCLAIPGKILDVVRAEFSCCRLGPRLVPEQKNLDIGAQSHPATNGVSLLNCCPPGERFWDCENRQTWSCSLHGVSTSARRHSPRHDRVPLCQSTPTHNHMDLSFE